MVYKFQKRPTELFLNITTTTTTTATDNNNNNNMGATDRENRMKSPSPAVARLPTPTVRQAASSIERKFKLIRKKSSKEKENLVNKGHVFVGGNEATKECPTPTKSTTKQLKNKSTNKAFTTGKLFDAVLDDDFSLARKCLIADEMDVNEYSPEGTTVLHLASAAGFVECALLLIECGANVNSVDTNGRSPLEYAVLYGNFECAALLIENGADSKVIKNGMH